MRFRSALAVAAFCIAAVPALAETSPAPAGAAAPAVSTPAPAATSTAPAGTTATTHEHGQRWKACAADVQKFCADAEKGRGMIRTCLQSHAAELSDGCKAGMAAHAAEHASQPQAPKTP